MESDKQRPEVDDEDIARLVSDWRKNRPDLSWKPHLGHKLQAGPKIVGFLTTLVYLALGVGLVLILLMIAAPRESREVTGTIITAAKPKSEEYYFALIAVSGEPVLELRYRGKATLKPGQRVTLEEVTMPLVPWKSYKFKDPPPGDSEE